jgi:hypothetical protein
VGARYYTTDDLEPQGWYMQLEFANLTYAKDIRKKDAEGQLTDESLRDERVYNDLRFLTGYQMLSSTSNWLFDAYGGIGMRDRHMDEVHDDLDTSTGIHTYTIETVDDIVPVFFLGIKVGLGL